MDQAPLVTPLLECSQAPPPLPWGWLNRCQGGRLYGCLLPRRALKTRGNTPKYGLIFHSTFIGRAAAKNKGRISRYLANKCTIASRIDCFSGGLRKLPERPTPHLPSAKVPFWLCHDGYIFRQQYFTHSEC